MWAEVFDILGDSHFEAYIGGPFAGVIAGIIFSSLGTRPSSTSDDRSPPSLLDHRVSQVILVEASAHVHVKYTKAAPTNDEGISTILGIGLLGLVASFLFAALLPQIAAFLRVAVITLGAFSVTAACLALLSNQFNDLNWYRFAILPIAVSLACFVIVQEAFSSVNPQVIEFAQSLLGNSRFSFGTIIAKSIQFYRFLGNEYAKWMWVEMLAFICVSMCIVLTILQFVYYISLANMRNSNGTFWINLAIKTKRFSGARTTIFLLFLLVLGWFCASGEMFHVIQHLFE